ncbi:MAG: AMP-binding protein [Steroidobacteraceae bacterium]
MTGASQNFYARFAEVARRRGAADCWIEPDGRALSWTEVDAAVAAHAAALRAIGVQPGDRVLVQVEKSVASLALYLGCLRAGAVFVPLNTAYTESELRYFIADAGPRLVVCDPLRARAVRGMAGADVTVRTLDRSGSGDWMEGVSALAVDAGHVQPIEPRAGGDLAAIVYTSGTTGRSKGAMVSHANLAANAAALIAAWQLRDDDVLLHALPTYHVHGLFVSLHSTLLAGGAVLLLPKFDVDAVLAQLPRATVFMGVPTYYTRLLADARFTREQAGSVRLFICGSAPLLPATFARFEQRTGQRILERYGMSEAGIITSNPLHGERLPGSVGYPLQGFELRIVDDQGRACAPDAPGMLEIRGPSVLGGYWRRPELQSTEFRDGWFVTGDLATRTAEGRVAIVGRARDLVISGGFNVYPREIELEIDALSGVGESAVIGVPHPDFGEAVVAVIVRHRGVALDEAGVLQALGQRLARFKLPKRVLFVDELPRNAMAKVQKAVLRETYAGLFRDG